MMPSQDGQQLGSRSSTPTTTHADANSAASAFVATLDLSSFPPQRKSEELPQQEVIQQLRLQLQQEQEMKAAQVRACVRACVRAYVAVNGSSREGLFGLCWYDEHSHEVHTHRGRNTHTHRLCAQGFVGHTHTHTHTRARTQAYTRSLSFVLSFFIVFAIVRDLTD